MSDSVRVMGHFCLVRIRLQIDEFLLIYLLDSVGLRVDFFMNFRSQLRSTRPVHSYNSNPISFKNLKLLKTIVKFISHIWDNKDKESNNSYFNITKCNPDRVSRYARRNLSNVSRDEIRRVETRWVKPFPCHSQCQNLHFCRKTSFIA